MKLGNVAKSTKIIAVRLVLSQADDFAIPELHQKRDVGFANGSSKFPAFRE
jgi:hypothetical protein